MTNPICADGESDMFSPRGWDPVEFSNYCQDHYGVRPRMDWAGLQWWAKDILTDTRLIFRLVEKATKCAWRFLHWWKRRKRRAGGSLVESSPVMCAGFAFDSGSAASQVSDSGMFWQPNTEKFNCHNENLLPYEFKTWCRSYLNLRFLYGHRVCIESYPFNTC